MKFLKSHFALSRSQQNGIFVLVLLIIVFQIVLFSMDFFAEDQPEDIQNAEIEMFQQQLDSLNRASAKRKDTLYAFNPNYITDFKGYQLGMSLEEIDRLLIYRSENKWINSAEDFQKVTGISDSLLEQISPAFRFPEWVKKETAVKIINKEPSSSIITFTDLNTASAEDLKVINGVGEVLSSRIIKYRNSIGGFLSPIQLNDVYGLSVEVIERILQKFRLLSRPEVKILDINSITLSELAEIPYFKYEVAREIISYRNLHEQISSFEELSKIDGFPSDKIDRIKLYLAVK